MYHRLLLSLFSIDMVVDSLKPYFLEQGILEVPPRSE
jgi:hypothetical protein